MTDPALLTAGRVRADALPSTVLGAVWIVVGGFVSAAAAPTASYHSSWAVAFMVLVPGAAQIFLGLGQAALTEPRVSPRMVGSEVAGWNLGSAAVLAGVLLDIVAVLYVGAVLLVVALALVLWSTRQGAMRRLLVAYRVVVVLLLVSIPIGIVLQAARTTS